MTEPTPPQQTQQALYTQVSATFAGMSGVGVAKVGATEVMVTYMAGSGATATSMTATFSTAQLSSEVAEHLTAFRDDVTNAKNLQVVNANKAVAAAAGVAPLRVEQFTSSPAAVAAATRINQTPLVTAKGSVPQIAGESNTSYLARINLLRKVTGDRSDASIAAAVEFQRLTAAAQDAADAKSRSREAGARKIQSAGIALSAALVRAANAVGNAMREATAQAMAKKGFRGRTGTPFANDRGWDPPTYIEIAQLPADVQGTTDLKTIKALGMKYNDFFITDTQEMDAEKADVSETFGAPHVFATGRYMRKLTIQGVCRTGAVNPDILSLSTNSTALAAMSDVDKARFVVPHTLGLRVLYDRMLRASEQISRSLFSRLVVDGEVYCGWFTTLNITRSGADEGFAHFTMSMLVFARYHKDEDWAAKLLMTGSLPAKNAFDDAAASATLASMVGKMTLKLSQASAVVTNDAGGVLSEGAKGEISFRTKVQLTATGVAQPVSTETTTITEDRSSVPLPGFTLEFGNTKGSRVPLNGSTVTAGTFDVVPVVSDFAALRDAVQSAMGVSDTGKFAVKAKIRIKPTMGEDIVELAVNFQLNTVTTPEAKNLVVFLGADQTDKPATSSQPAKEVFQSATTSEIVAQFNIFKTSGSPLDVTNALNGSDIKLMHATKPEEITASKGSIVSAKTGTIGAIEKADIDAAAKPGAATSTTTSIVATGDASSGQVRLTTVFDYSQLAGGLDLQAANPFVSAKDLETSFRYKIKLQGFNEFITPIVSVTAQYAATWISKLLQSISAVESTEDGIRNSGSHTVSRVTFKLSTAAAPLFATGKREAVKQAIELIMAGSTYEVSSPGVFRRLTTDLLTQAKVTDLDQTSATVAVPIKAGLALSPLSNGVTGEYQIFTMTVPQGIRQLLPFIPAE